MELYLTPVIMIQSLYFTQEDDRYMAKAEIHSGICGFSTQVEAVMQDGMCQLHITSACKGIQKLADQIPQVDPYREISFRGQGPQILQAAASKTCPHPACPVPAGIIKAVEVAAGLALPADVTIHLSKE
jgi:hypothetical protein